jgi:hypothetical protein
MAQKIKEIINDPEKLEKLFRDDKKSFESDFETIYPEIRDTDMARFWKSRIDFDKSNDTSRLSFGPDLFIMIAICLIAGFFIKFPDIFGIDVSKFHFYEKETGIIIFLGLSFFLIMNNKNFSKKNTLITSLIFLISILYINLLPDYGNSSTLNLLFIHMPLFMWCLYGLVYAGYDFKNYGKRIDFVRHNGDLAIIGTLILISGGIMMAVTLGLFQAIGINISKFYTNYIVVIGCVSAPVITSYILKNFSTLTNKIAPIIANLFSPLVLITLVIYIITILITGKNPYNDRNFLLIFNIMLIGVMAIIVFSVSEISIYKKQRFSNTVLFILSIVTLIVNLIALSAIFYRLNEFGPTPNRISVLGSNILIFINLILITIELFKINFRKAEISKVELIVSKYMPVYLGWIMIVIFLFPLIFGLR